MEFDPCLDGLAGHIIKFGKHQRWSQTFHNYIYKTPVVTQEEDCKFHLAALELNDEDSHNSEAAGYFLKPVFLAS